jgi:hypothetical protein
MLGVADAAVGTISCYLAGMGASILWVEAPELSRMIVSRTAHGNDSMRGRAAQRCGCTVPPGLADCVLLLLLQGAQ